MKNRSDVVVYSINNKQVSIEEFYSSLGNATEKEGMNNHLWVEFQETPTTSWYVDLYCFTKVSMKFCDLIADTCQGSGGIKVYYEQDSEQLYITYNGLDFAIIDATLYGFE